MTRGISYENHTNLSNRCRRLNNRETIIRILIGRTGTCDNFAYLAAYIISAEIHRRKQMIQGTMEQKSQIHNWGEVYLTSIPGHTFILIGQGDDPRNDNDCIVLDPWVIDPTPHLLCFFKIKDKIMKSPFAPRNIDFEQEFEGLSITMNDIELFVKKFNLFDLTETQLSNKKIEELTNHTINLPIDKNPNPSFYWIVNSSMVNTQNFPYVYEILMERKGAEKLKKESNELIQLGLRHRTFSGQKETLHTNIEEGSSFAISDNTHVIRKEKEEYITIKNLKDIDKKGIIKKEEIVITELLKGNYLLDNENLKVAIKKGEKGEIYHELIKLKEEEFDKKIYINEKEIREAYLDISEKTRLSFNIIKTIMALDS